KEKHIPLLAEFLDPEVKRWSNGKEGNLLELPLSFHFQVKNSINLILKYQNSFTSWLLSDFFLQYFWQEPDGIMEGR
ncbi:hypothetical protein ACJX0J_013447, partial [Zea mays]